MYVSLLAAAAEGAEIAGIQWDPTIRGLAIVGVSVLILCGSVYLLLATNTGSRTGFLLAGCGLVGWLFMLSGIWWVYGLAQGPAGRLPAWEAIEIVQSAPGDPVLEASALNETLTFPDSWSVLTSEDKRFADIESAAARYLIPATDDAVREFEAPFQAGSDFVVVSTYRTGGDRFPMVGNFDGIAFFHEDHFSVVTVQGVLEVPDSITGIPTAPQADPTAPLYSVVLERDRGARRLVPAMFTLVFGVLFALSAAQLHLREKKQLAAAGAPTTE